MEKLLKLVCFIALFGLAGCSSYNKIPYFQDIDRTKSKKEAIQNFTPITIQPEDILSINVASLNTEASAVFNYNLTSFSTPNSQDNTSTGYIVDQKGEIHFPVLGSIKVAGYTTFQLREQIRSKLLSYLKEPVVNIRLLNFKISVMGDVLHPGVYQIQNERVTITEALSMAGDLNITAKRNNVLLIREQDGHREYIPMDLTSKNLFQSSFYYLKNNDVIYVQPDRARFGTADRNYRNISLLLSAASIAAIIITRN